MRSYLFYKKIIFIFFINFHTIPLYSFFDYNFNNETKDKECCLDTQICPISCNPEVKTLFLPLSISQNLYTQYHKPHCQKFDLSLTYRFVQAANNNDIALSLFNTNPLLFVGSTEGIDDDRPLYSLVPEYFGLGGDTNTSLYLTPQIRNQVLDLQLSFQADSFWTQVNIPLVKGQWKTNNLPIVNNNFVGVNPLESDAQAYIYNLGGTFNAFPTSPPPGGANTSIVNYNLLPIVTTPIASPNYTGAYIISSLDASDEGTFISASTFTPSDENLGSINMSNSIYDEGFTGNEELNSGNWKLNIGTWQQVKYEGLQYEAAYTPTTGAKVEPASLNEIGNYTLSGSILNVNSELDGQIPNTMQMTQEGTPQATSLQQALSGEYTFNQSMNRLYNNINFNTDYCAQTWGIADIIIWSGYDFCNSIKKHIGFYLHGVIPTGTNIDQNWYHYALTPVIGNGHHYQLGIGVTGHYLFCQRRNYTLKCNINGYVDHVFAANQFRVFDQSKLPMSRYAVIKKLVYTGDADENTFNDDYQYSNLDILGNVNNSLLSISNNFKGEFIIDLLMSHNCFEAGFGYAFSGLSGDIINCNAIPFNGTNTTNLLNNPGQVCYGYKGNTAISNLIVINITAGEETFNPANPPLTACPNATTVACNYPVAAFFPAPTPTTILKPNPNTLYIKSCGDVTIGGNSGAYLYGESAGNEDSNGSDYVGTTSEDVLILPDVKNNTSGLIGGQILNRLFGHVEYSWDTLYNPKIGLIGSYGFGSKKYFTAFYWDLGFYLECSF
jgi:hypothetical protein